ncbi:RAD55 family ATPase [Natronomonas marina]|uniref:RAD55 family ATPase n=1 Tax=Natronomonas marina TaxID=2961939 RepID=UPI003D9C984B
MLPENRRTGRPRVRGWKRTVRLIRPHPETVSSHVTRTAGDRGIGGRRTPRRWPPLWHHHGRRRPARHAERTPGVNLAAQRPTLYLSTRRNEESVRDAFHRADLDIEDSMIAYADPDADLDDVGSTISRVGAEQNPIIDPANPLERWDPQVYQQFLNRLHTYIRRTGSIAVVHCHTVGDDLGREVTLGIADVVRRLDQTVTPDAVESTLVVSKFRGGRALTEPITLELTDNVRVDTSRNVA